MGFQSGVSLPGSTWDDFRTGTSLAGDISRLIGGGLRHIGGVQRQQDKEAKDRAFRESEAARQGSQFDRTLAQNDRHFELGREDKYRLEAIKSAQTNGWTLDDNNEPVWQGGSAPADYTPPTMSVPAAKAAGVTYQQRYGADPMDMDSPATPQEKAAMASGGLTAPVAPIAPPRTAFAGSRTPPLAVVKASATAKERAIDNARADESLSLARAAGQRAEAEAKARATKEQSETSDFQTADDVARGMYDVPPVFAPDVRRDKDGKPAPVYKTSAGAEYAARAFGKQQAEQEKETGAQTALVEILKGYAGKIPADSPYARNLVTHGPDGKPLPSKQLEAQRKELERNLDDQTRAEARASRVSQIEARRTARDAAVQAAEARKMTVDQIKAEAQLVEREIETMLDTTDIFAKSKLKTDPTFVGLEAARERLARALMGAVGPAAPTTGAAPAEPTFSTPDEGRAAYVAERDRLGIKPGSPEAQALQAKFKARVRAAAPR